MLRGRFSRIFKSVTTVLRENNALREGISCQGSRVVINHDSMTVRTLLYMSLDEQGHPRLAINSDTLAIRGVAESVFDQWKAAFER